jgi:hypothetical protein
MIPSPDTVIGGAKASEIYRKVFAPFARMMAEGRESGDVVDLIALPEQRLNIPA